MDKPTAINNYYIYGYIFYITKHCGSLSLSEKKQNKKIILCTINLNLEQDHFALYNVFFMDSRC